MWHIDTCLWYSMTRHERLLHLLTINGISMLFVAPSLMMRLWFSLTSHGRHSHLLTLDGISILFLRSIISFGELIFM